MAETTADRTVFNPLTSGRDAYKPDNYKPALRRAILKLQGFNPNTYNLSRFQLHHVVLTSILQPFLQGRTVTDQARIIKLVEESVGSKFVNNIENLVPMGKELHIKGFGAVHKLIQEITDLQGRPQGGLEVPGKTFQKGAKSSTSLENVAKYAKMSDDELVYTLTGWVKLVKPELEKQVLVAAALTGERQGRDFATYLANTIENGPELLQQGIQEQLLQNQSVIEQFKGKKKLSPTDKKIINKIKNINRQANLFNRLGPIKRAAEMNPEELYNFNKTRTIMGVYQDVGKGVIKPGKSEKILAERLAEVNKTIPKGPGVGFEDTTGVYQPNSKVGRELGEEVVQEGGKTFLKKYGKQIAVAGVGFSLWNTVDQAKAAIKDPSKANLTRLGLSGVETLAEGVSAAGILAAAPTGGASLAVVPAAEGISTAAGAGELGSYLVEHRKKIWSAVKDPNTYRQLAGNTKDFLVEKATDDKGLSSLWSKNEEKKPPEAVYWR